MTFVDILLVLLVSAMAFLAGFGLRGFLVAMQEPEWVPSPSNSKHYEPPSRRVDLP